MKTFVLSMLVLAAILLIGSSAIPAHASQRAGYGMSVLIDDEPQREYSHDGTVYIEAVRGRDFSIRLTNPNPYRVAIALSVDGLNTIDAKHTSPWQAAKWIVEPYGSTEIAGWQVSGSTARSFYFTGEKNSYGAALGQTANLGVIEAVVYRERPKPLVFRGDEESRRDRSERAPAPSAGKSAGSASQPALEDDYAATGMGDRRDHSVEMVAIDLDPSPEASFRIRYEFRPQLVRLGVIPRDVRPLDRREHARGFDSWCPDVK